MNYVVAQIIPIASKSISWKSTIKRSDLYFINSDISYKVTRLNSSSLFAKIGIKRGDMIMLVNNQKFKSISEPLKFFQNLQNIKQLSITVKRNGKTKELKYEIY